MYFRVLDLAREGGIGWVEGVDEKAEMDSLA